MTSLMEEFVKTPPDAQFVKLDATTSTTKNADRLVKSKSKKRVAFASESSLEDQHSFERVTLRVSRLAELWHPNPHNQDVWLLPDEEVSDESVILMTWAYGHNGWVDFKKSIPQDVQEGNPLSRVQKSDTLPGCLTDKVSLETWQALFGELKSLLDSNMDRQPDFEDGGGGCCGFFSSTEKEKRLVLGAQRDRFDAELEGLLMKYNAILLGIDGGVNEVPANGSQSMASNTVSFSEKDRPLNLKHMVAHYNRVGYIALFYYWVEIEVSKIPDTVKMV